jgi:hypothetical protein
MQTRKELAAIISESEATGRPIEWRRLEDNSEWEVVIASVFTLESYEYRVQPEKPKMPNELWFSEGFYGVYRTEGHPNTTKYIRADLVKQSEPEQPQPEQSEADDTQIDNMVAKKVRKQPEPKEKPLECLMTYNTKSKQFDLWRVLTALDLFNGWTIVNMVQKD